LAVTLSAGKVTAGLAESNGSLPPGGLLKVACGLTACKPGSAPGATLGNECGETFLPYRLLFTVNVCALQQEEEIQNLQKQIQQLEGDLDTAQTQLAEATTKLENTEKELSKVSNQTNLVNSALHPFEVAKSSTSLNWLGGGEGGNVTSAG